MCPPQEQDSIVTDRNRQMRQSLLVGASMMGSTMIAEGLGSCKDDELLVSGFTCGFLLVGDQPSGRSVVAHLKDRLPRSARNDAYSKFCQSLQRRLQRVVFFGEAKTHHALVKAVTVKG